MSSSTARTASTSSEPEGEAGAAGPGRAVNDLGRGALVEGIVWTVAVSALQARP